MSWCSIHETVGMHGCASVEHHSIFSLLYVIMCPVYIIIYILLPKTDVIRSTEDFLPYVSKLEPYLTQLGTVLGIADHTSAIVESPANPNTKVLDILKHWIDVTPGCTWNLFYGNLGKSDVLKTVRQMIKEDYNITGIFYHCVLIILPSDCVLYLTH